MKKISVTCVMFGLLLAIVPAVFADDGGPIPPVTSRLQVLQPT